MKNVTEKTWDEFITETPEEKDAIGRSLILQELDSMNASVNRELFLTMERFHRFYNDNYGLFRKLRAFCEELLERQGVAKLSFYSDFLARHSEDPNPEDVIRLGRILMEGTIHDFLFVMVTHSSLRKTDPQLFDFFYETYRNGSPRQKKFLMELEGLYRADNLLLGTSVRLTKLAGTSNEEDLQLLVGYLRQLEFQKKLSGEMVQKINDNLDRGIGPLVLLRILGFQDRTETALNGGEGLLN